MIIVDLQNVETGESFRLKEGLVVKPCKRAMLFIGALHIGTRVKLEGPGISTGKEAVTPIDSCVPNMPFELVPGTYKVELFIDADDIDDEVLTFKVVA